MTSRSRATASGGPPPRTRLERPERVWRPVRARRVALVLAAVVAAATLLLAAALPREGAGAFSLIDRFGIVLTGAVLAAALGLFARTRAELHPDGLLVVNLLRRRRVAWAEVLGVSMDRDASWASLDLSDGTALAVMALQAADGAHATRGIAELRGLLAGHDPAGTPGGAEPDAGRQPS